MYLHLNKIHTKYLAWLLTVAITISSIPAMSHLNSNNDSTINSETRMLRWLISSEIEKVDIEHAIALIESGADPNVRNDRGETLLMRAVRGEFHYRTEAGIVSGLFRLAFTVAVIVAAYTLYDSREAMFDSILNWIGDESAYSYGFVESFEENMEIVIEALKTAFKNITERGVTDGIRSTLEDQYTQKLVRLIETLMESGADPYLENFEGQTPIGIAIGVINNRSR